jgi:putative exosortase-associated protein (TIGR04073 family)
MGKIVLAATGFLCFLLVTAAAPARAAQADTYETVETSSPQKVVDGMANKAVRGIANIAGGWIEFPKQVYLTSTEEGVVSGLTVGSVKGIGMTVVRTVTGVYELATFYFPYPGFYGPVFDPAYVWQRE